MNMDSIRTDVKYALRQLRRAFDHSDVDAMGRAMDALERIQAALTPAPHGQCGQCGAALTRIEGRDRSHVCAGAVHQQRDDEPQDNLCIGCGRPSKRGHVCDLCSAG